MAMVVPRYEIPTGIPCVDGLSTGPLSFGVSHYARQSLGLLLSTRYLRVRNQSAKHFHA